MRQNYIFVVIRITQWGNDGYWGAITTEETLKAFYDYEKAKQFKENVVLLENEKAFIKEVPIE